MSIDVKDLYDQAFAAHRHASDYRAKIMSGWAAMYTAFGALFVWSEGHERPLWVLAVAGALMTLAMWLADHRNRPAIGRAKDIGKSIEEDAASQIPDERRFFSKLDKGISHSTLVDIFAVVSIGGFFGAAFALK